jgi:hypothetical protein
MCVYCLETECTIVHLKGGLSVPLQRQATACTYITSVFQAYKLLRTSFAGRAKASHLSVALNQLLTSVVITD